MQTNDVKGYINIIFNTFELLKELTKQSKIDLSEIDKELSSQYHKIEGTELEYLTDSQFLIMKLKDILNRRRIAKINHTMLESIVSTLETQMGKSKKRNEEIIKKHSEILKEIITRAK